MRHLSLFTGVGGGDLAHQHLLGWQTVGYVEFDKYCQQVLAQRIKDGFLQEAPIFGDIDHFIESGAVKKYKGYIDVVTAGFPCQPFSVAGKQAGEDDPRNKWPQTIQCIRDIRPRYAFLENVPGLLNSGYFPEILGSLAEAGFDARWIVLGADDVGAPHRRKRLWILAYPNGGRWKSQPLSSTERTRGKNHSSSDKPSEDGGSRDVAYPQHARPHEPQKSGSNEEDVRGATQRTHSTEQFKGVGASRDVADSDSERLEGQREESSRTGEELSNPGDSCWWSTEPNVGRVANGVAHRVDRLKAIGNGQVSRVAATAWRILNDPNS